MKITYKLLIILLSISLNLFSEEKDEGVELLYQRLSDLEKELAELRSQLEENTVLMERSLELQQQRYLDLDSRILELSSAEKVDASENFKEEVVLEEIEKEKLLYRNALELFEESRYAEALENFSEIIISYPNGSYTPDAYFWSGELFLAQDLFEDAKISYEEVSEQFPSHIRAADSLYKLGEIYRVESNYEMASSFFNKVISYRFCSFLR